MIHRHCKALFLLLVITIKITSPFIIKPIYHQTRIKSNTKLNSMEEMVRNELILKSFYFATSATCDAEFCLFR